MFDSQTESKVWEICSTSENLWWRVFDNIIVIHALLGCDTTSRGFSIGIGAALSKLQKFLSLLNKDTSKVKVKGAAERVTSVLTSFCDDKVGNPLDQTCLFQFHQNMP